MARGFRHGCTQGMFPLRFRAHLSGPILSPTHTHIWRHVEYNKAGKTVHTYVRHLHKITHRANAVPDAEQEKGSAAVNVCKGERNLCNFHERRAGDLRKLRLSGRVPAPAAESETKQSSLGEPI